MKTKKTLESLKTELFKDTKNDSKKIVGKGDGDYKCVWVYENGRLRDSMIFVI